MSLITERFLICDVCGIAHGVDNRQQTAEQLRQSAKLSGWLTGLQGKDYCGKHNPTDKAHKQSLERKTK